MVPRRGLEPPRPCERQHLKLVRLPIPPPGHGASSVSGRRRRLRGLGPALSIAATRDALARPTMASIRLRHDHRHRVRRQRLHRPLCLRISAQGRGPAARRRARSARGLFPPAAGARSGRWAPCSADIAQPRFGRRGGRGRRCGDQSGRRVQRTCTRSTSMAPATSPRPRRRPARRRWSMSARSAPMPMADSRLRPDQGRGRSRGAHGLPGGDHHPPVAGVRARRRADQPLRGAWPLAGGAGARRPRRVSSRSMSATLRQAIAAAALDPATPWRQDL